MTESQYLSIEIRHDKVAFNFQGSDYQCSPDFSEPTLRALEDLRRKASPEKYGQALYGAVFREEAREGLEVVRSAIRAGTRVRLGFKIDKDAPALHGLWWEAIHESDPPSRALGCFSSTPLSRYLELRDSAGGNRDPIEKKALRVLVAISNPADLGEGEWASYPPLAYDDIEQTIDDTLGRIDRIEFEVERRTFPGILRDRLKDDDFHVLHLVAHGGFVKDPAINVQQGFVLLQTRADKALPVNEAWLGRLVQEPGKLQLVVLMSCEGAARSSSDAFRGLAPQMLRFGLPAVVAMQDDIEIERAGRFTERFYTALANTKRSLGLVDAAVNDARDSMYSDDPENWSWCLPVLFMRGSGVLFAPPDAAVAGSNPQAGNVIPLRQRTASQRSIPEAQSLLEDRVRPARPDESSGRFAPIPPLTAGPDAMELRPGYQVMLRVIRYFSDRYLFRTLCLAVGVAYEDLQGDYLAEKALVLVERFTRQERLDELERSMDLVLKLNKGSVYRQVDDLSVSGGEG